MNTHYLTPLLVALSIYLLWMDVMFYLEVQNMSQSKQDTNVSYSFSPFRPVTVKLMMLPPTVQYLDEPLAYLTVQSLPLTSLITPNTISLAGVFVSAAAARLFIASDIRHRQLGVGLFKVRDLLDSLDGGLARELSHTHSEGLVANPGNKGWYVDGFCDAAGDFFRFVAFVFLLERAWRTGAKKVAGYQLLGTSGDQDRTSTRSGTFKNLVTRFQRPVALVGCTAAQFLVSAVMWNLLMISYHRLLETKQGVISQTGNGSIINEEALSGRQREIIKSSPMWMVCYFWRLVNPQNLSQVQLLALLYGKEVDLLVSSQLLGFLPPLLLGLGSYIHLLYVEYQVTTAACL